MKPIGAVNALYPMPTFDCLTGYKAMVNPIE